MLLLRKWQLHTRGQLGSEIAGSLRSSLETHEMSVVWGNGQPQSFKKLIWEKVNLNICECVMHPLQGKTCGGTVDPG